MVKGVCMFLKGAILIITPFFLNALTRARIYSFTESVVSTYRCLLPVPVWVRYMLSGYYTYVFAGFVLVLYGLFKRK
jgi:hypothetical protein